MGVIKLRPLRVRAYPGLPRSALNAFRNVHIRERGRGGLDTCSEEMAA